MYCSSIENRHFAVSNTRLIFLITFNKEEAEIMKPEFVGLEHARNVATPVAGCHECIKKDVCKTCALSGESNSLLEFATRIRHFKHLPPRELDADFDHLVLAGPMGRGRRALIAADCRSR